MSGLRMKGTDLSNFYLLNANMSECNLCEVHFHSTNLQRVNLKKADLSNSYLCTAKFQDADFAEANLEGARLYGAQLDEAKNLTQMQIDSAYGNEETKIPHGLVRPKHWMGNKVSVKKCYLKALIRSCLCFRRLLGKNICKHERCCTNRSCRKCMCKIFPQ